LTPYSRKEFEFCRDHLNELGIDDVERARRFFVAVRQSFNACMRTWGYAVKGNKINPKTFYNAVDDIPKFVEFLKNVQIECDDFEHVIKRYDAPGTFFYCDPPYVVEIIKKPHPYKSMSLEDHMRLVNVLLNVEGKVMLSGYDHPVYRPLEEAGWRKKKFKRILAAANPRKSFGGKRVYQTECLWLNYDPPKNPSKKNKK